MIRKIALTTLLVLQLSHIALARKIIIDAGHGGNDSGASYHGVKEAEITLQIAKKIKFLSSTVLKNDEVILTREIKRYLPLDKRVQITKEVLSNPKDAEQTVFVSLHANASPINSFKGFEIYIPSESLSEKLKINFKDQSEQDLVEYLKNDIQESGRIKKSLELSQSVKSQLGDLSAENHFSIRRAPFYVIDKSPTPAILVELGYLSNRETAELLANDEYQQNIALRILKSLAETTNLIQK